MADGLVRLECNEFQCPARICRAVQSSQVQSRNFPILPHITWKLFFGWCQFHVGKHWQKMETINYLQKYLHFSQHLQARCFLGPDIDRHLCDNVVVNHIQNVHSEPSLQAVSERQRHDDPSSVSEGTSCYTEPTPGVVVSVECRAGKWVPTGRSFTEQK